MASSLWGLAISLCVLMLWLTALSADSPGPLEYDEVAAIVAVYLFLSVMYPTLGALIASRHPSDVTGWMFCGAGSAVVGAACAQLYAGDL